MIDERFVDEAMERANPRPRGSGGRDGEWSTSELLLHVERRSVPMETITRPVEIKPMQGPGPNRRRGLVRAAAAFAVVLAIGATAAIALRGGSDSAADVAALADATPAEIAQTAWERLADGDVAGFEARFSPDMQVSDAGETPTGYFDSDNEPAKHQAVALDWYAHHVSLGITCTDSGAVATCNFTPVSPLGLFDENGEPTLATPETIVFTIEDGLVVRWDRDTSAPGYDARRQGEYEQWLEGTHPDAHAELFAFGSMIFSDREQAGEHRAYIAEWAESQ